MAKLKKNSYEGITEISLFRHFPLSAYLILVSCWAMIFLFFSLFDWINGKRRCLSIKESVVAGMVVGVIYHLPKFLYTFLMNLAGKPLLKLNSDGFYYTPHLWSRSILYNWEDITLIEVKKRKTRYRYTCTIYMYLTNGSYVSLNAEIMPISYNELLRIFQLRLKDIQVQTLNERGYFW